MLRRSMEIMARDIREEYDREDGTRTSDYYSGISRVVYIIAGRLPTEAERAAFIGAALGF